MAGISAANFSGLNKQSYATYDALTALNNADIKDIPKLAAMLQAQSSALESLKKAHDDAFKAMAKP